ncbi:hypothetical protein Ahy_A08g039490 isoform C [Arachis hypogaea]|uniref:Uncharacterized protein n=1 Tax=Arachis hypogaea TaxID=3818 RepID=A0A445BWF2_ARAHY|nr:hypothetical protein Ahy_A08g039490 isoform C [Arachis hypogaea]
MTESEIEKSTEGGGGKGSRGSVAMVAEKGGCSCGSFRSRSASLLDSYLILVMEKQGCGSGHNDQKVLVLAATNTPYALDQVHLGDTPNNLTEKDFEYLASRTDGFSGSDISVCVKDVLFEPVRKTQDAMYFYKSPDGMWIPCGPKQPGAIQTTMQDLASKGLASKILPPPITRTDFEKVLARQRPTVSKADLDVHERFTKEFGEEG